MEDNLMKVTPTELLNHLIWAIPRRRSVLVVGRPGIGKTDIWREAAKQVNAIFKIWHPVVMEAIDPKGLPWINNEGIAEFKPFKYLQELTTTDQLTVVLFDDLGQAPIPTQNSLMQLLLLREINGVKISDKVVFGAATNRREDHAGVFGISEPVKSRFKGGILHLETNVNDWIKWAISNKMPNTLISFMQFKPDLLKDWKPEKDIINGANPRTIAGIGEAQNDDLPINSYLYAFTAIAGEKFAIEYTAFLKLIGTLPTLGSIRNDPHSAPLPTEPGAKFAIIGMISEAVTRSDIDKYIIYLQRLEIEIQTAAILQIEEKHPELAATETLINWKVKNQYEL